MKKIVTFFSLFLLVGISVFAQMGINADNTAPNSSAMLDVKSSTKGLLIPRMTQTERNAISAPATGLMIFQTDQTAGFYFFQTTWKYVGFSGNYNDLTNKLTMGNGIKIDQPNNNAVSLLIPNQTAGDMMYFDGTNWVLLPHGGNGENMIYKGGKPKWSSHDKTMNYIEKF
jgi:hypothetical protein